MKNLATLRVKIYADGADKAGMLQMNANPLIKGMTTNPTLMRKAGLKDFEAFATDILQGITEKPISFEVFSDEFSEMRRQAMKINGWAKNVFEGVKLNVTAILTLDQVSGVAKALNAKVPSIVSVFAGRIADTGVDPMPEMRESKKILAGMPQAELLWASVREVLNIFQADECGCDIVTVPHDILNKAQKMTGMGLKELSLDTVKMFASDAAAAGFAL
jgi:transaldolase